jgi:hypothetical protein
MPGTSSQPQEPDTRSRQTLSGFRDKTLMVAGPPRAFLEVGQWIPSKHLEPLHGSLVTWPCGTACLVQFTKICSSRPRRVDVHPLADEGQALKFL